MSPFKYSRMLYLDNHLSEGIHTWIIYVMLAFLSCYRTPGSMPGDGATGSKSSTCLKRDISGLKFSRSLYLDNHQSENIHTRTKGTLRVGSNSITLDRNAP